MTCRAASLLFAALLVGGCAPMPHGANPRAGVAQRMMVENALSRAASQVRGCYRAPRVSFRGRQIVTRLRVRFTPEGELADLPRVMFQDGVTPENQSYAPRMAQAAIEAVLRCTPLRLPPALYRNGWSVFELTFSPNAVA
jgi:hypothetical protein